jgi:myo-inositol-1(or 4)-monophosphatase
LLFVALGRLNAFVNVKDVLLVTDMTAKQLIMVGTGELVIGGGETILELSDNISLRWK